jgi:predicted outer membrane lipoprotein
MCRTKLVIDTFGTVTQNLSAEIFWHERFCRAKLFIDPFETVKQNHSAPFFMLKNFAEKYVDLTLQACSINVINLICYEAVEMWHKKSLR